MQFAKFPRHSETVPAGGAAAQSVMMQPRPKASLVSKWPISDRSDGQSEVDQQHIMNQGYRHAAACNAMRSHQEGLNT